MKVGLLGEEGSGKTTWMGLLFQTMRIYTNIYPDEFSYYMDRNTTEFIMDDLLNPLLSKKYPQTEADSVKIKIGFKRDLINNLKETISRLDLSELTGKKKTVDLKINDILRKKEKIDDIDYIMEKTYILSNYDIIIYFIDCSKFDDKQMSISDENLIKLLSKSKYNIKIFFTKMDRLKDENIRCLGEVLHMDRTYERKEIIEITRKIFNGYLPSTYEKISELNLLDDIDIYFSWIKNGDELRLRRFNIGNENTVTNIYPVNHYLRFLESLKEEI